MISRETVTQNTTDRQECTALPIDNLTLETSLPENARDCQRQVSEEPENGH